MQKRIVVDYEYHALDFTEKLTSVVNTMVETEIKDASIPRGIEDFYDNIYVESTQCEADAQRAGQMHHRYKL